MQNGYADDMIFSVPEIVSHLSRVCAMTLIFLLALLT